MSPDTRIKDMYGLGVAILTAFVILGHFLFKGGTAPPHMAMTYIIRCFYTQGTRIYMV
jgi:hypothetical protein